MGTHAAEPMNYRTGGAWRVAWLLGLPNQPRAASGVTRAEPAAAPPVSIFARA